MFLLDAVKREHICDAVWIVLHGHASKFTLEVRNGGASIAVHSNGLVCLSDILQELWVGDLIDCALIIQKDVVLVDDAFHFLLHKNVVTLIQILVICLNGSVHLLAICRLIILVRTLPCDVPLLSAGLALDIFLPVPSIGLREHGTFFTRCPCLLPSALVPSCRGLVGNKDT